MNDIQNRKDIERLVNTFYNKVRANAVIGYIFDDVVKVNWDKHLPIMYSFWASLLLGEDSYTGNPMTKHILLSKTTPMTDVEFAEWQRLFHQTVNELFSGEKANEAKLRADNIARLMLYKIQSGL
ncbi:MAG: group III truncated hemoglobin [Chitinophagaceae bacterium]|jgi:hemoglobin|nr:group III truncated hemoglobin [Chitinophagaceae bacterium]